MHHAGDDAGPTGLMARAQTRTVVAMEVLVEENQITPMRVFLELLRRAVNGASAEGLL